jgi:hypothetical protein
MFEKSLTDLVKGLRNHKHDQAAYLSKVVAEIKRELRGTDQFVKFVAVQKATYLQMMGIDVGFAAFHIVEVMSAQRFAHRRAGLLAAAQTFNASTEVVLLTTNLLKKQLHDPNQFEQGCALNCLSNIANRALARDLLEDVAGMLGSSRPLVRKKAVVCLYKLYLVYPHGLPQTFDRLRARLEDADLSVVSCAVNVICELSRKNSRNFLALAPQLFQLMTTSTNNWMVIKIVKLMSALLPEEPRLARKLLEPLARIVETTQAKSLLYECIHTVTLALAYAPREDGLQPKAAARIVQLCSHKLREFVLDPDQNLKYLGLVGFVNLMRSHPNAVTEHKEMVLRCLVDEDLTVRLRALELLTGMVTRRNLVDIVQKLIEHVLGAEGGYRDEIIDKIVFICSRDKYAYLASFPWYVSVLVDLAHIRGAPRGDLLRRQLVDVCARVPSVRPFAVRAMSALLLDGRLVQQRGNHAGLAGAAAQGAASSASGAGGDADGVSHVLLGAGWVVCEYASLLGGSSAGPNGAPQEVPTADLLAMAAAQDEAQGPGDEDEAAAKARSEAEERERRAAAAADAAARAAADAVGAEELADQADALVDAMLTPLIRELAPFLQAAFAHNVLKLVAVLAKRQVAAARGAHDWVAARARLTRLAEKVTHLLAPLALSEHVQVQERAVTTIEVLVHIGLSARPPLAAGAASPTPAPAAEPRAHPEAEVDLLFGSRGDAGEAPPMADNEASSRDAALVVAAAQRLGRLFELELAPVAPQAQSLVPLPQGLDLETPISLELGDKALLSPSAEERAREEAMRGAGGARRASFRPPLGAGAAPWNGSAGAGDERSEEDEEEDLILLGGARRSSRESSGIRKRSRKDKEKDKEKERARQRSSDPFYLGSSSDAHAPDEQQSGGSGYESGSAGLGDTGEEEDDSAGAPVVRLESGALGELRAGSRGAGTRGMRLLSEVLASSSRGDAGFATGGGAGPGVLLDDAVPEGSGATPGRARPPRAAGRLKPVRRGAPAHEEEGEGLTLADIDLVLDGESNRMLTAPRGLALLAPLAPQPAQPDGHKPLKPRKSKADKAEARKPHKASKASSGKADKKAKKGDKRKASSSSAGGDADLLALDG